MQLVEQLDMVSATPRLSWASPMRKGSLAPGIDADIIVLDQDLNLAHTIIAATTTTR